MGKSKNSIERVAEDYFRLLHKKDAKVCIESITTRQLLTYEGDSKLALSNRLDNTIFTLVAPPAPVPSSPSLASTILGVGSGMGWWGTQKTSAQQGSGSGGVGGGSGGSGGGVGGVPSGMEEITAWLYDAGNPFLSRQGINDSTQDHPGPKVAPLTSHSVSPHRGGSGFTVRSKKPPQQTKLRLPQQAHAKPEGSTLDQDLKAGSDLLLRRLKKRVKVSLSRVFLPPPSPPNRKFLTNQQSKVFAHTMKGTLAAKPNETNLNLLEGERIIIQKDHILLFKWNDALLGTAFITNYKFMFVPFKVSDIPLLSLFI